MLFLRQKNMEPNVYIYIYTYIYIVFFHLFINQLIGGGAPPYMNRIRLKTMAITVGYNWLDPSTGNFQGLDKLKMGPWNMCFTQSRFCNVYCCVLSCLSYSLNFQT